MKLSLLITLFSTAAFSSNEWDPGTPSRELAAETSWECVRKLNAAVESFYEHVLGQGYGYFWGVSKSNVTYSWSDDLGNLEKTYQVRIVVDRACFDMSMDYFQPADGDKGCRIWDEFSYVRDCPPF